MTAIPDRWWRLWHEPWLDMDPAWCDRVADSPSVQIWRAARGPGQRRAYLAFCASFGVRPHLPLDLDALSCAPAIDRAALSRAALALGRLLHVHACLQRSPRALAHLCDASADDAQRDAWRQALRQARARALPAAADLPPPPDTSIAGLTAWALPGLLDLIDRRVPGAAERLRLRLSPDSFDAPGWTWPAALDPQRLHQQLLRPLLLSPLLHAPHP